MYSVWRACERLSIRPDNVKINWDDNDVETQANILAYGMIRDREDNEIAAASIRPF
jgi:hypothetical protein